MKRILCIVTLILALHVSAFSQRADIPGSPVIVVTGEAQIRVVPDEATVRLGIVRQANTAQVAQDQANTAGNDILAAIAKAGVAAGDIQTSRLTLSPVYSPRNSDNTQAPKIVAYSASNVISVRLSDLGKVGPTIDAGLKAGANEIQGVQFALRDDMPARLQALKQAVSEARKKAEAMAEALNVRIGTPLEVSENGAIVAPRSGYSGSFEMALASAKGVPAPVSAGELEVHANVTVRYQILPK